MHKDTRIRVNISQGSVQREIKEKISGTLLTNCLSFSVKSSSLKLVS